MNRRLNSRGFTLIEVVLVIIIAGILLTVAMRAASSISKTAKIEQTKQEMERLHWAITGNPHLYNSSMRSDFGYLGDVGAVPPNLEALITDPGLTSWRGPYFFKELRQIAQDHTLDAWNQPYSFTGTEIISNGSGAAIVRRLCESLGDLVANQMRGSVLDRNRRPPGPVFRDSIRVRLTHPDGSGGQRTRTASVDAGGYYALDSIPVGIHSLMVIFEPTHDTIRHFVAIAPGMTVTTESVLTSTIP